MALHIHKGDRRLLPEDRILIIEWNAMLKIWGKKCLSCQLETDDIHADHIRPVVKGGVSEITNLQPLCRRCNSKKHDKQIDFRNEWHIKTLPAIFDEIAIQHAKSTPVWVGACEASRIAGIHRAQIYKMTKKGLIPKKDEFPNLYYRTDLERLKNNG